MKVKKIVSLLLMLGFVIPLGTVPANAANPGDVVLKWTNTSEIVNGLDVDGQNLIITAGTSGYYGCDSCAVTATLEVYEDGNWVTYQSWREVSDPAYPDVAVFGTTISVPSGLYRLCTSHSVTSDGLTEFSSAMSPVRTVS